MYWQSRSSGTTNRQIILCRLAGRILLEMNEFTFQTAEIILSDGIVIKIPLGTDTISLQTFLVSLGGILDAAVTMEDQPFVAF